MKKRLKYTEVNITNVCNYSCSHCQSLNNYAFKGHQFWKDHEDEYRKLSNNLEIDQIQIIGGEPTLNPDFEKWVIGISELWPNSKLQISTNGSRLDKLSNYIYKILLKHKGTLWITCHDITLYDKMLNFSKEFLDEIIYDNDFDNSYKLNWRESYDALKEDNWPNCNKIEDFVNLPENIKKEFINKIKNNSDKKLKTSSRLLIDKNGVEVIIDWSQSFVSSVLEIVGEKQLQMKYNSDPVQAHNICNFKTCHQINKGKLYKCPLVSVLPDFLDQFDVVMSDEDKQLAYAYKPMSYRNDVSKFINDIDKPIPQCKFCPTKYNKHNFVGTDKKIKIKIVQE